MAEFLLLTGSFPVGYTASGMPKQDACTCRKKTFPRVV